MATPEKRRKRHPLLGLVAYTLVPGERRTRAMGHFRRAGVELLRGVAALAAPEKGSGAGDSKRREQIEID